MDNFNALPESQIAKQVAAADTRENFSQEAAAQYYVCKDGVVVAKPSDCRENSHLPELKLKS
ncbi:MAG TPA: hypothetical protein PKN86_10440 [Candidatus Obscuribacter sp.]|nr:hypothetical protein [Candidatus Obscuribacter sp.]MBK9279367.1 hypothetical protein [Candidatus Obscuribacter sp.]MBL8083256.1 hypothetical protein [Candidatus Obscuribacter sp.]HMW90937.1 hypothetical protein [Candidatus Obscuribacter sp.]HMY04171.1 hypothetical protein [Candidatus Obscuribacter sp.]